MKYLIDYGTSNNMKGGGYVLYCNACGAPLNSYRMYTIKDIEKKSEDFINKLPNEIYNLKERLVDYPDVKMIDLENKKKYQWLNNLILLDWKGENKEIIDVDSWDKQFKYKNGEEIHILPPDDGIILHKDCYKLIKSQIGDFNYYNSYNMSYNMGKSIKIMNKYQLQDYRWIDFFYRKEDYLLESPLKNKKNKDRMLALIKKNFKKVYNPDLIKRLYEIYKRISKRRRSKLDHPDLDLPKWKEEGLKQIEDILKIVEGKKDTTTKKLKKDRPSPAESATQFKEGTKKKGNDGNMYIIAVNKNGVKRWKKV